MTVHLPPDRVKQQAFDRLYARMASSGAQAAKGKIELVPRNLADLPLLLMRHLYFRPQAFRKSLNKREREKTYTRNSDGAPFGTVTAAVGLP